MLRKISIGGKAFTLELVSVGEEGHIRFRLDSEDRDASAIEVMPRVWSVLLGQRSFEVRVIEENGELVIEINGKRYLRGIDLSQSYRPTWPIPEPIEYDETWCAALDQEVASMDTPLPLYEKAAGSLPSIDIDAIDPTTVFMTHDEPAEWANGSVQRIASNFPA
jgi:hypothetical protein